MPRVRRERGTGSISRRADGTWTARATIGINPDGSQRIKALYGKTESEVKKKLKEYMKQASQREIAETPKTNVASFMTEWLTSVKVNELKPSSYDRLEQTIDKQIIPYIGGIQIASLNADDLQYLLNTLREEGYSYSVVKKTYNAFTDCFKNAVDKRKISHNPTNGVSMPRSDLFEEPELKYYDKDEAKALCAAATSTYSNGKPKYRLGHCIPIMLNTGLRAAEMAGLRWTDVNFESRELYVRSTRVVVKDRTHNDQAYRTITQKSTKTKSGSRTIALNDMALQSFRALKKLSNSDEFVFANADGDPMIISYLGRLVAMVAESAGFKSDKIYGPHALRHTFASMLFDNGIPIETISKLMGHKDVATTQRIYIHIFNAQQKQRSAVEGLANIF